MTAIKQWTVVALYDDNDSIVDHVPACSPAQAAV